MCFIWFGLVCCVENRENFIKPRSIHVRMALSRVCINFNIPNVFNSIKHSLNDMKFRNVSHELFSIKVNIMQHWSMNLAYKYE